jgi:hypothetical protein
MPSSKCPYCPIVTTVDAYGTLQTCIHEAYAERNGKLHVEHRDVLRPAVRPGAVLPKVRKAPGIDPHGQTLTAG